MANENLYQTKQSAKVPVITGGLAMGWGYFGAFVWKQGAYRLEKEIKNEFLGLS